MEMRKYSGTAFLKVGDVKVEAAPRCDRRCTEGKFGRPDRGVQRRHQVVAQRHQQSYAGHSYGGESDDWINKEIELSLGEVEYDGQLQETVVVKPISPPIEKKPPRRKPGGDMKDEIPF